jgi:hypothetical protein
VKKKLLYIALLFFNFCYAQVFPVSTWNKPIYSSIQLTTSNVSSVSVFSATSGGTISGTIEDAIISKGVCWSTSQNPTIYNNKSNEGSGSSNFSSNLSSLNGSTRYYIRSFLTTNRGTIYGNEISFNTKGVIGDAVLGGKIAYVLQNGDPGYDPNNLHGLIITNYDLSDGTTWGCYGTDILTSHSIGSGSSNTLSILSSCNEIGIAAKICSDLELNGYDDWFLPSVEEWKKIYPNSNAIGFSTLGSDYGPSGKRYYWSSTQSGVGGYGPSGEGSTAAVVIQYPFFMSDFQPYLHTLSKGWSNRVRAIRSF